MSIKQVRKSVLFPIVSLAALLQFCTPSANKSSSSNAYHEDLSVYRESNDVSIDNNEQPVNEISEVNQTYITPTNDITDELDSITSLIIESKKDVNYVDGFTIQVYSGNSRDKAGMVKQKAYDLPISQDPQVSYDQPNYKVRIGKYYTRIEANEDYNILKDVFSRAVLIPSKIKIEE